MSLLFPDRCMYCGEIIIDSKVPICDECIKNMPVFKEKCCNICGRETAQCFCKIGDFAFDRNISVMRYDGVAKTIIRRMKFGKKPQLISFLANEMALKIKKEYKDKAFDFVTFVPMHPIKQMRRGFNQSYELAKIIAYKLDIPLYPTLKKKFKFKSQKNLKRKDRFKNIRGTFKSINKYTGKNILIIDDIMTTGATLSECALTLKRSGALHVFTATFAITYKK